MTVKLFGDACRVGGWEAGDGQRRGRGGLDDDAGLGAGDGSTFEVSVAVDDLGAGRLERGREGVRAGIGGGERVVGRQAGLGVAAGECDRAGVAGGDVAVRIVGGDGEVSRPTPAVSAVGSR